MKMKLESKFMKEIVTLALPAGFQQVINLAVNLIDNLMIGSLGEASISAVSICGTYMWLVNTFVNGLASGAVIIAAQDWGNQNVQRIKKLLSLVLSVSLGIGLVFFCLTAAFPQQILKIYSNAPEIIAPGTGYLYYIKYSFPMIAMSFAIMLMLRAVRSVKLGLYTSVLTCGFNIFFNWVFIYGKLGAPAMGAAGAALASTLSYLIQCLVSLIYLFFFEKNLHFKFKDFNPFVGSELFVKWLKIAFPLLLIDVMYNFSSSAQTMITGRISTNYVTANSIVHMGWQVPDVFCQGVSMAAGIMIGNALGAKQYDKARREGNQFIIVGFGMGLFSAVVLQLILPCLIQFYHVSEATQILARQMGYAASVTVFANTICAVLSNGVIKGAGHTKLLMKIDLISIWCIAIPLGYIGAFALGWPAAVLYLVLRSGSIIKTIWSLIRMKKGDWIQNLV